MTVAEVDVFQPVFAEMPPGPGLALLLGAQDHGQLDDFDVLEVARSARRLGAWAAAQELGAIAVLAARRKACGERLGAWDSEAGEWVIDEVAAGLTLSVGTAARRVAVAERLVEDLPGTFRALADGLIDADKAKVIAEGVRQVSAEVAQRVERQVLPAAPGQTCAKLRHAVRKAVLDADPEAATQQRQQAEQARRLELWPTDNDTSDLTGRDLPAEVANAAFNRVNAIAAALKADGDARTMDQLRADVFAALLRGWRPEQEPCAAPEPADDPAGAFADGPPGQAADPAGDLVPAHPHDPTNPASGTDETADTGQGHESAGDGTRVVPHHSRTRDETSTGAARSGASGESGRHDHTQADHSAGDAHDDEAGEQRAVAASVAETLRRQLAELTSGLDPKTRTPSIRAALVGEAARRMKNAVADVQARWCITTTGPGEAIRHGTATYRVPARMLRQIQNRDGTCRFPGCRRKTSACDVDHTVAHHKGGPTCPCNLANLCRRHHRLKQRPEWQLIQVWHGVLLWIAPTGHWYITGPGI